MTPDDLALEDRIELAYWSMMAARNTEERGHHWDDLKHLIQQRRAERVAAMEAEQGLAG